jgi:integrase
MSKLMYKIQPPHMHLRHGVYYFVRRIPADLRAHYRSDRISLTLRTRSQSTASRSAQSINQRLEDYWLGLRLQQIDIPAINLLRVNTALEQSGYLLSDAKGLYLRLKGSDKDRTFFRTAERNTGYVIRVLGDRSVTAYSSSDAAQFRDWLIKKGMSRNTIKRVFGSIRSIINLTIKENGLEGHNGFSGTYLPDGLQSGERKPVPLAIIRQIQDRCIEEDDELRWIIALLSDTGMRLGEAIGLLKQDIVLDKEAPYINLQPHPWRRLKTSGSERQIPLVGSSLWAARRVLDQRSDNPFAFPRYCKREQHNTNSASAALNKWMKGHAPKECVIHSFRHSIRDRLRAVECPSDIVDRIGGWITSGVGHGYGSGYPVTVLHRWMEKIT